MTDSHNPTDTATADALESVTSTEESIDQHEGGEPTELSDGSSTPADEASEPAPDSEASEAASDDEASEAAPDDEASEAAPDDEASEPSAEVEVDADAPSDEAPGGVDADADADDSASGDATAEVSDDSSSTGTVRSDGPPKGDSAAGEAELVPGADPASAGGGGSDDFAGGGSASGEVEPGSADHPLSDGSSSSSSSDGGELAEELMLDLEVEPPAGEVVLDDVSMRRALEAILMVTDEPLPALVLARAVGRPVGDVSEALGGLAEEYTEQGRGFDLREVGGGWRYYTRPEQAQYVEKFVLDGQQARLTQAALETLAVVAYKQPVSRARVSAIRGVNVDGVMRTLISRGLVEEAGADTESQATLYRTSSYFLERMGMQSLDDLPELAPYLPEMDDVEEELAAQNTPTPEDLPTDGAGTPDAGTPEAVATPEPDEAVTSDVGAAGIDGDLGIGDAPDLDLEHDQDELEPAEELEAGGDTDLAQEEADPAEFPESGDAADAGAGDSEGIDDERGDTADSGGTDDDPLGDSDEDDSDEDDNEDDGGDEGAEADSDDDRLEPAEELTGESGDDLLDSAEETTEDPAEDSPTAAGVPAEDDGTTGDAAGPGAAQYRIGSDD
ncbi:SMC-Scp complex subunit ScpB [Kribbella sp. CA-253562]|uniref:SMC-Scp complex subunit ScpB n=1 Tax=Kribbella sp. CA-253562 TaxID=3239942 RepID=UPI003D8F4229